MKISKAVWFACVLGLIVVAPASFDSTAQANETTKPDIGGARDIYDGSPHRRDLHLGRQKV
jgi:hypothetical protein